MIASGLGQGIGQGISNYAQISLQQKMTNLQNQKEGTALAQAIGQPHLSGVLSQLGPEGRKQALEYTGMQARNDALLEEAGLAPQQQQAQFTQQQQGPFGGNMFAGQGAQQPQASQEDIPYQDREAVEDIPAQQMAVQEKGIPPGVPPKMIPQVLAARRAQEGLRIQQEKLDVSKKGMALREKAQAQEVDKERLKSAFKTSETAESNNRIREQGLSNAEFMVKSGKLGAPLTNWFIDKTGLENIRTPEAAAFLTSNKEAYLSSLTRAGSRPNMWIEQLLQTMLPQLTRSEAANLAVLEVQKGSLNVDKEEVRALNELHEKYPDDPAKVLREKNKRVDNFAKEEQKRVKYRMQTVLDQDAMKRDPEGFKRLTKVPPGTPLTKEKAQMLLNDPNIKGDKKKGIALAKQLRYNIDAIE